MARVLLVFFIFGWLSTIQTLSAQSIYRERYAYHDSLPASLKPYDAALFRQGTGPLGEGLGRVTIPEGMLYMGQQTAYNFLSDDDGQNNTGTVVGLFLIRLQQDTIYRKIVIRYTADGHFLDRGMVDINKDFLYQQARRRYNGADGLSFVRFCSPPQYDPNTHTYTQIQEMFSASQEKGFQAANAFIFLRNGYLRLELQPMAEETCQESVRVLREAVERIHLNPSEVYTAWSPFDTYSGFPAERILFGTDYPVKPSIYLLNLIYVFRGRILIGILVLLVALGFVLLYKKE